MVKPRKSSVSTNQGTAPRMERKIIEKNRRTRMKILLSNLISLLPKHTSKVEGLTLPDQINEVVEYISSLKQKLVKLRQKKESLLRSNNSRMSSENNQDRLPVIEVHEMGSNLDVILTNGLQDYSTFSDILRVIHDQTLEIASATFTRNGNSTIQVLKHNKVGESKQGLEGATISRKLKELVSGTSSYISEVVESQLSLWDYKIESNIWGCEIFPQTLPAGTYDYYQDFSNKDNNLLNFIPMQHIG